MNLRAHHHSLSVEEEVKSDLLKELPDLKTLREERGVTIEDIFLKTRISASILNAIENGEFHLLPAPVYAKNFIQNYANVLGVDSEIILAHYQRHVDEIQIVPEEVKSVKAQISFERIRFPRYLFYAVPAVAIFASTLIMYAFFHDKETLGIIQHKAPVNEQKKVVSKPFTTMVERHTEVVTALPQAPPSAKVVQKEATPTPHNTHLNLHIEATENTWLNITEDRNPPYQTTLKRGDTLSRKAREFFIIDVGNAAGVKITFLGKSLGNLGRKGQVVHLRLPQQ